VTEIASSLQGPVVVRSPNWLGDAVMALPAVRNLKDLIEDQILAVATPEKLAALWEKCPFVDEIVVLKKPKNLKACAAQLREGKYGSCCCQTPCAWPPRRGWPASPSASAMRAAVAACC
jgi:hypothetical protein